MADSSRQPATEPLSPERIERRDTSPVNAGEERSRPATPDAPEASNIREGWTGDWKQLHEDLTTEYYKLVDIVTDFDQRLLTVKGWGVTLSLASLGFGFHYGHYGLFLVAAASGLGFWLVEAVIKSHQIRYYPRMRDIEVASYGLYHGNRDGGAVTSPLIDWGWDTGPYRWKNHGSLYEQPRYYGEDKEYQKKEAQQAKPRFELVAPFLYAVVMLPHVISVVGGLILFSLGLINKLPGLKL
jgi:hypothetical protein